MKNELPRNQASLLPLGANAVAGLHEHEAAIQIKQNTEAAVTGDLDAYGGAADEFATARRCKRDGFIAQAGAIESCGLFIGKAVDVLTPYLGRSWSTAYVEAGFAQSLAVPTTLAGRLETIRALIKYLKDRPQYANAAPEINVTTAQAQTLYDRLRGALSTVARCKSDTRKKKKARATTREALLRRLRGLVNELDQLLPAEDARWATFGFNAPGETQAPEAVETVEVEGGAAGELLIDWDDSARAERYRVELLVVGTDTEFRRGATVQDSSADLEALPPGAKVKLRIVAANAAGESTPSEVVEATVPLAA